ncbi:MAG: type I-C CRISPR-associated protein Cas8c/Csd1 [Edaphobacter sp.]
MSFCVVLEADGRLNGLYPLLQQVGKARIATPMIVPGQSKPTGQGINPCFLWDNASYMLGWSADADKLSRSLLSFEAFRKKHFDLETQIAHPAFTAVCSFLRGWSQEQALEHQVLLEDIASNFGVFRLAGERKYVHELVQLPGERDGEQGEAPDGTVGNIVGKCLITGTEGTIARLHEPTIKGVVGAQSSGARIVSFNAPAFESYGRSQSYNAPVTKAVAEKYATVLNHLLDRRDRRVQLGDSTVVFWADHAHPLEDVLSDLFAEPFSGGEAAVEEDKDRVRQARLYLTQMRDGAQTAEIADDGQTMKFFMLGL